MAIVITNGQYYMRFNGKGQIKKTPDITEARKFYNVNVASMKLQEKSNKSPVKCSGYYVFDTDGDEHALSRPKKVTERKKALF